MSAGSGKTSGEWTAGGGQAAGDVATGEGAAGAATRGSSVGGAVALPASSFLGELDAGQAAELGAYALRLLGPGPVGAVVAAFGLLFIPSSNNLNVTGPVPGVPGLSYSWNRDETLLHLSYADANGKRTNFTAQLEDDVFRDQNGNVVARILPGGTIVVDKDIVFPDSANDNEPKLCPLPAKDKRTNDLGLDYENYIKKIVNPENPTLPFMGYVLPNAAKAVTFDDCEHSTGTMVEIKDGYEGFLASNWGRSFLAEFFLEQAMAQVEAAGTRPVRWYFSQKDVADYAREIFKSAGLGNIEVKFVPRPGREK